MALLRLLSSQVKIALDFLWRQHFLLSEKFSELFQLIQIINAWNGLFEGILPRLIFRWAYWSGTDETDPLVKAGVVETLGIETLAVIRHVIFLCVFLSRKCKAKQKQNKTQDTQYIHHSIMNVLHELVKRILWKLIPFESQIQVRFKNQPRVRNSETTVIRVKTSFATVNTWTMNCFQANTAQNTKHTAIVIFNRKYLRKAKAQTRFNSNPPEHMFVFAYSIEMNVTKDV